MLRRAGALLFLSANIAAWVGCGTTKNHFVFVAVPASNELIVYREDPNSGILTTIKGSPYTIGSAASPESVALHPTQPLLYLANSEESDVALFTVSTANGSLTEITPRTATGTAPTLLSMDPGGNFLYVANSLSNNISTYAVSSNGTLTPVTSCPNSAGSPFPVGTSPISMKLSPSGSFLYVGGAATPGFVEAFSVSSGCLTAVGFYDAGTNPVSIDIDPTGTYLYTANSVDGSISEFTIDPTSGALQQLATVGEQIAGAAPLSVRVDPSGKYLIVANEGTSNLSAYSIGSGGGLTVLPTSPTSSGSKPNFIAADPNNKYMLVGNQSGQIQTFGFDVNTGALTLIVGYSTGSTPTSIAVMQ
jgi:6-phosphogluconolactonase